MCVCVEKCSLHAGGKSVGEIAKGQACLLFMAYKGRKSQSENLENDCGSASVFDWTKESHGEILHLHISDFEVREDIVIRVERKDLEFYVFYR